MIFITVADMANITRHYYAYLFTSRGMPYEQAEPDFMHKRAVGQQRRLDCSRGEERLADL